MILSTSNSKLTDRDIWLRLFLAVISACMTVVLLEFFVRLAEVDADQQDASSIMAVIEKLKLGNISGREVGNQMLIHNIAFLSKLPNPEMVSVGYVGTSRTKVLRPEWFGIKNAVNGSGNSYNEISYGLLLQAEVLRILFPNIKRIYFESSLLLRRPNRLILEEDHRKYLPLLNGIMPIREKLKGAADFRLAVDHEVSLRKHLNFDDGFKLHIASHRSELRLANYLLNASSEPNHAIPAISDSWLNGLKQNGERKSIPVKAVKIEDQKPEITNSHVKVQRLRSIPEWNPWDGLFDLIAVWGKLHGIEIVFFQPPVRSDLYKFQLENGLEKHTSDMERVAKEYGIPFVDLDKPELGYMGDWSLFSDEDHMETCSGVLLLQTAIEKGRERYYSNANQKIAMSKAEVEASPDYNADLCD